MCRWVVYKGAPILISQITHKPEHSLVNQSKDGGFYPGCDEKRNIRVNGDGFGLAWYTFTRTDTSKIKNGSCVFKCVTPAWNNHNLWNLVNHVESPLIFGHVRAVHMDNSDFKNNLSEDNCHPFVHKRYTFMHNGAISGFPILKRRLRALLPDPIYDILCGSTDSEHVFGVLLDEIGDMERELTARELGDAVERVINRLAKLSKEHGIITGSSLNFAVTDGRHIVATRCRNDRTEAPPSLFYCLGGQEYWESACDKARQSPGAICISSEPLTRCKGKWSLVPNNHMIVVPFDENDPTRVRDVVIRPIDIDDIKEPLVEPSTCQNKCSDAQDEDESKGEKKDEANRLVA